MLTITVGASYTLAIFRLCSVCVYLRFFIYFSQKQCVSVTLGKIVFFFQRSARNVLEVRETPFEDCQSVLITSSFPHLYENGLQIFDRKSLPFLFWPNMAHLKSRLNTFATAMWNHSYIIRCSIMVWSNQIHLSYGKTGEKWEVRTVHIYEQTRFLKHCAPSHVEQCHLPSSHIFILNPAFIIWSCL